MKTNTNPHRSWFRPRAPRTVDKKGVAVALAFLVAIAGLAGGRGEKSIDRNGQEERPVVSTQVDYRLRGEASYDDPLKRTDQRVITPPRQEPQPGASLTHSPISLIKRKKETSLAD